MSSYQNVLMMNTTIINSIRKCGGLSEFQHIIDRAMQLLLPVRVGNGIPLWINRVIHSSHFWPIFG
jgi:hypothetical protein